MLSLKGAALTSGRRGTARLPRSHQAVALPRSASAMPISHVSKTGQHTLKTRAAQATTKALAVALPLSTGRGAELAYAMLAKPSNDCSLDWLMPC